MCTHIIYCIRMFPLSVCNYSQVNAIIRVVLPLLNPVYYSITYAHGAFAHEGLHEGVTTNEIVHLLSSVQRYRVNGP